VEGRRSSRVKKEEVVEAPPPLDQRIWAAIVEEEDKRASSVGLELPLSGSSRLCLRLPKQIRRLAGLLKQIQSGGR
jgi:hypothetical protein